MTDKEKFAVTAIASCFSNDVVHVRDELQKIVDGEIERSHCTAGTRECYGGKPGKQKLMLADAKKIAKHCVAFINRIADEFEERMDEVTK